jgi:hypothetical protein
VFREELAVAQGKVPRAEASEEKGEGNLGGIPRAAEHAFGEESSAKRHAIYTPYECSPFPDFDGMGLRAGVKSQHGGFDRAIDPGLWPVCAAEENAGEVAVGRDAEAPGAEALGKATRAMKAV